MFDFIIKETRATTATTSGVDTNKKRRQELKQKRIKQLSEKGGGGGEPWWRWQTKLHRNNGNLCLPSIFGVGVRIMRSHVCVWVCVCACVGILFGLTIDIVRVLDNFMLQISRVTSSVSQTEKQTASHPSIQTRQNVAVGSNSQT